MQLEFRVVFAQWRRDCCEYCVQIELVPARIVGDGGLRLSCALQRRSYFSRRFLLPRQLAGVDRGELDFLRRQIFAQQPRLRVAEIGKRVVIVAQARLAVANQIDRAQLSRSTSSTAACISPLTRRSKSRKRWSRVWPRT